MTKFVPLHLNKHTGPKHTATVIFFHGSGGTGADLKEWVRLMSKNFSFAQIKVMYPTAILQPYTPSGGQLSNVWFDRAGISINVPEKLDSIARAEGEVKKLIQTEVDSGVPLNRIVVGGFSMGGALALHTAYRWSRNVAGVFAFSSFLNKNSVVYEDLKNSPNTRMAPLLQIHGDYDELVPLQWGETTFNELNSLGVQGEFHVMERLGHSLNKKGIHLIRDWIDKLLPET